MNIQDQVKVLVENNSPKEQIYLDLLQKGFTVKEIELALKSVTKRNIDIQSQSITLIIFFGAISIGLAAISFIASNWNRFGDVGKVGVISIGLLIAYIGVIYTGRIGLSRVYNGLILLAQLIFGAGVFLMENIASIQFAFQVNIMIWLIGVLLAAYMIKAVIFKWIILVLNLVLILSITEFFYTYDWYQKDYQMYAILGIILATELFFYLLTRFKKIDYNQYLYD